MKKVLFLSFYWPPSGKASIHWPIKMIKYLPEFGWEPSVLTVKEDTFSAPDETLFNDINPGLKVYKTSFWDPFIIYKKLLGKPPGSSLSASEAMSTEKKGIIHRISLWIRLNLFIPDARVGWVIPGFRDAKKLLKNENFDLIVSNGPPHSTHLLALKLKREFNIPLVSVFIDPWVDISYYKGLTRSKRVLQKDNTFEKKVIENSDSLVFVTEGLIDYFENKYPGVKDKSNLLHWGYNEENFDQIKDFRKETRDYKILLHAGNIFDHQNPKKLWTALKREINSGNKIIIRFIGTVSPGVKKSIEENGLTPHTEYNGFLPYNEMIKEMLGADYLLVCATEPRHVPGKLFEYMRTGNKVLAFGDDNEEVKKILNKSGSGNLYSYSSDAAEFFAENKKKEPNLEEIKKFDRKVIAEKLGDILTKTLE